MSEQRHQVRAAAYVLIQQKGKLLFLRRRNTGFMDGKLGLPSGHVEPNESLEAAAAREAKEEIGITINESDLKLVLVGHRYEPTSEFDYVDFYFEVEQWSGEIINGEPHKASELVWESLSERLDDVVPYLSKHLAAWRDGRSLISEPREDVGV